MEYLKSGGAFGGAFPYFGVTSGNFLALKYHKLTFVAALKNVQNDISSENIPYKKQLESADNQHSPLFSCNPRSPELIFLPQKSLFDLRDSGGTQTRDTQNRNLMLYSTELRSL